MNWARQQVTLKACKFANSKFENSVFEKQLEFPQVNVKSLSQKKRIRHVQQNILSSCFPPLLWLWAAWAMELPTVKERGLVLTTCLELWPCSFFHCETQTVDYCLLLLFVWLQSFEPGLWTRILKAAACPQTYHSPLECEIINACIFIYIKEFTPSWGTSFAVRVSKLVHRFLSKQTYQCQTSKCYQGCHSLTRNWSPSEGLFSSGQRGSQNLCCCIHSCWSCGGNSTLCCLKLCTCSLLKADCSCGVIWV